MAGARCSCGFIEVADADETIGDHLFEVLAPDDDKGADGHVHLGVFIAPDAGCLTCDNVCREAAMNKPPCRRA